jgi:hypothetical protein
LALHRAERGAGRARAGSRSVAGLDALLERLAAERIDHDAVETYSNGVRHVKRPQSGSERDRDHLKRMAATIECLSYSARNIRDYADPAEDHRAAVARKRGDEEMIASIRLALWGTD